MSNDFSSNQGDHSARDAERARRLGRWLEGDEHALDEGSDFFAQLFAYRRTREEKQATEPSAEQSARMWAAISRSMRSSSPVPVRIFSLRSWRAAAAVAACLLLGSVIFLLLTQTPDTTLVATSESTPVMYTADDGSTVTLRPHSELHQIAIDDEAMIRYRIVGEGYFAVTPSDDRVVQVQANDGLVTVLGTRFSVSTWRDRVEVALLEGSVRFEHTPSGRDLVMEPGSRALLAHDGNFEQHPLITPQLVLGWLDNELVFEERLLKDLLAELEHHHRIRLQVPQELENQTLTGRILLDDPQQSLDDLGVVMGGTFERVDERTYRFRPE